MGNDDPSGETKLPPRSASPRRERQASKTPSSANVWGFLDAVAGIGEEDFQGFLGIATATFGGTWIYQGYILAGGFAIIASSIILWLYSNRQNAESTGDDAIWAIWMRNVVFSAAPAALGGAWIAQGYYTPVGGFAIIAGVLILWLRRER